LIQNVSQSGTTTKVTASDKSSVYGEPVTFTATVTATAPGSGTPTGSATFMDGTMTLDVVTLSGGAATFSTAALSVGSHPITVVYSGDPDFIASTSAILTQTVAQAGTSTAVTSSLNPSTSGQAVTFTAAVSPVAPGSGTPIGTVTFYDGSTMLGADALSGGIASFATPALSVGTHSIKAVYAGDVNFKTSTSAVLDQVVEVAAAPAAIVSTSSPVNAALAALQNDTASAPSLDDLAADLITIHLRRTRVAMSQSGRAAT